MANILLSYKKNISYQTNILELYNYLMKYHEKESVLAYTRRLCKKIYVTTNKKYRKVTIEEIKEKEDPVHENKKEINIIECSKESSLKEKDLHDNIYKSNYIKNGKKKPKNQKYGEYICKLSF